MVNNPTVQNAKSLLNEGQTGEAIELLSNHLNTSPDDGVARTWLAHAYFKDGDYPAAEAQYRMLVAGPDPNPRDLFSLGSALEKQGKIDEARAWVGAAAAADPTFAPAVAARDRLAKPIPSGKPPTPPYSELTIPTTEEELEEFTRRRRARAQQDWLTDNWYSIPIAARIFGVVALLAIAAFIGFVAYKIITNDSGPPDGFPNAATTQPNGDSTTTATVTETTTTEQTDTDTTETETTDTTGQGNPVPAPGLGDPAAGKEVFLGTAGCGSCHTLEYASTTGAIGPNLDEAMPSEELVLERVTNGKGAMPSFYESLSSQQISDVAAYVVLGVSQQ